MYLNYYRQLIQQGVHEHQPDVVVVYADILGNSLEDHRQWAHMDPLAVVEEVRRVADVFWRQRFVFMGAQWRQSFGASKHYVELNRELSRWFDVVAIRNSVSQSVDGTNLHHTATAKLSNLRRLLNYI